MLLLCNGSSCGGCSGGQATFRRWLCPAENRRDGETGEARRRRRRLLLPEDHIGHRRGVFAVRGRRWGGRRVFRRRHHRHVPVNVCHVYFYASLSATPTTTTALSEGAWPNEHPIEETKQAVGLGHAHRFIPIGWQRPNTAGAESTRFQVLNHAPENADSTSHPRHAYQNN